MVNALITSSKPLCHKSITKFLEQVSWIYKLWNIHLLSKWPSECIIHFWLHQRTYLASSKGCVLSDATEKLYVWMQNNKESLAKSKMKNRLLTYPEPAATVQNLALSNRAADLHEPQLNWECPFLRQGAAKVSSWSKRLNTLDNECGYQPIKF